MSEGLLGRSQRCGSTHLATARDYAWMRPTLAPVVERMFHSGSPLGRQLGDVDFDEIVAVGRGLLEPEPRTRAELSRLLAERWPKRDATAMGVAAVCLQPTVQVTPRGVWGERKQATWALAERWIGRPLAKRPAIGKLITLYLGAFGPASIQDIRSWPGLTGVRELVEPLRPKLRTYRDGNGAELLDRPDAPIAEGRRPLGCSPRIEESATSGSRCLASCGSASGGGARAPRSPRRAAGEQSARTPR